MSKVMRSVKNVTKGYSSTQVKVREGELPPGVTVDTAQMITELTDLNVE